MVGNDPHPAREFGMRSRFVSPTRDDSSAAAEKFKGFSRPFKFAFGDATHRAIDLRMALIQVPDKDAASALTGVALNGRWPLTTFLAKEGEGMVFAVPDLMLDELRTANLPCRELAEKDLPDVLDPKGLDYYRRLKGHRPEHLTFEAALPPHGMRSLEFHIPASASGDLPKITGILEAAGATEISSRAIRVFLGEFNGDQVIKVACWIPEGARDALLTELSDAKLAGYSRGTQLLVTTSPDRA